MEMAGTLGRYSVVGDSGFRVLLGAFYQRVESDPVLRSIFSPDLANGRQGQYLFLRQYSGGPASAPSATPHPLRSRILRFAQDDRVPLAT